MMKKYVTLIVIVAMTLPGLLAALPTTQGLPGGVLDDASLLLPEAGAGASGSGPSTLYLRVIEYDPLEETVELPAELMTRSWDGLFLVQFVGPTRPQWRERVEGLGASLLDYIPDDAFIVRMTRNARRDVVDLPFVRWVGPLHPGLKVEPDLWRDISPVISTAVMMVDDPLMTALDVKRLGGAIETVIDTGIVLAEVPRSSVVSLARSRHVSWIEHRVEPEFHNDNSARLAGARQGIDGEYNNLSFRMWSYNPATDGFEGTTGKGYIVSAADTGLDDEHGSMLGHLPTVNYLGGSTTIDTYGHGTHVLGTAAGTGLPYPTDSTAARRKYIGVAPEANVFMQDIYEGFQFYSSWDVLGKDAYNSGAVVSSNSWGSPVSGSYDATAIQYDRMVLDADTSAPGAQKFTFCFSAGNSGGSGIASPASAKNVITVGAGGNDKGGTSSATIAGFSSRGPTQDGRIKPDVVASGVDVVSAMAKPPTTMPRRPPADGGQSWTFASGTSMSCPAVAGTVALVHQWSEENWDGHTPSPAMTKALLINGADRLPVGSSYPNGAQGWGRVNLTKLHERPNYRTFFYDEDTPLQVGVKERQRYIFALGAGERMWITLVWSDYAGAGASGKALVSDLDLVVRAFDGTVYKGNNFNSQGFSQPGTDLASDSVNNVEKFYLPDAPQGFYSVEVIAKDTPQGAQRYTLVAQGDLADQWRDLAVLNATLSKMEVDEGEGLTFSGDIAAMGTQSFVPFDYEVYVIEKGTGAKTVFEAETITGIKAWESRHFKHTWTAIRGDWDFVVDVDITGVVKEFAEDNNRANLSIFVKGYGMVAEIIPANTTVWPGLNAHLMVNVLNIGNVPDTYVLSTEGIPVGWHVSLDMEEVRLGVRRTGTITLKVQPPSAAKAGERYLMFVDITSVGNSTYTARLENEATVGQVHGLDAVLAREQTSVKPGRTVVHEINITNTGNGEDTFELDIFGLPPRWNGSFSSDSVTIVDNVTTVVQVELRAPEQALMNAIADVDITVKSSAGAVETINARTRVRQVTGMDAALTAMASVWPGGRIPFSLYVFNLGNGVDVFTIAEVRPQGWRSTFALDELVLDAYENFAGEGELICPANARAGVYRFTVQVSTGEFLKELTVDIEVEEVYGISKVLLCGASAIYPGNETTYCLEVTSLSNLPTDFSFRVEDAPTDWTIQVDPASTVIDPYHSQDFAAVIMPPKTTPNGFYQLKLILEFGPGAVSSENITIYVLEEVEPDVPDDGTDWLSAYMTYIVAAIVLLVVVIIVALLVVRSRRGGPKELPFEAGAMERRRPLPPPPPPGVPPRRERPLPPPPPPRTPGTVEELLADTPVMHRVSSEYDRYSADSQYATGETLAVQAEPVYVEDCPSCGGKVLEHSNGLLMCADCGAQYTEE